MKSEDVKLKIQEIRVLLGRVEAILSGIERLDEREREEAEAFENQTVTEIEAAIENLERGIKIHTEFRDRAVKALETETFPASRRPHESVAKRFPEAIERMEGEVKRLRELLNRKTRP